MQATTAVYSSTSGLIDRVVGEAGSPSFFFWQLKARLQAKTLFNEPRVLLTITGKVQACHPLSPGLEPGALQPLLDFKTSFSHYH